jgi:hypothetical protein
LNNARPAEVPKFIVLATDGRQNTFPSPYDNDILQTAIDNAIVVFTVGIGGDVDESFLKDIACQTDQHRFDPADNCQSEDLPGDPAWDTTNFCKDPNNPGYDPSVDPATSVNDLDCPAHYFFADKPDRLTEVYKEIADEITRGAWYQIIDVINTNQLFQPNIHDLEIINCVTRAPWDADILLQKGDKFIIVVKDVNEGEWVCVSFRVNVKEAGDLPSPLDPDGYWVNQTGITAIWDPQIICDTNGDGDLDSMERMLCLLEFKNLPNIEIINVRLEVIDPSEPWLKTTGGDVGSATTEIDMARDDPPIPGYNADYLVIAGGATSLITNFTSARDWLIEEYSDPDGIAIRPEPVGGSMYDAMHEKYTRQCGPIDVNAGAPGPIAAAITPNCNILRHNIDDLTITAASWQALSYTGDPAVVFVRGDMNIRSNIEIDADTGIIFVVNGDIRIDASVDRIDGIYITDENFNTYEVVACGGTGEVGDALTINGAVYVFGEACFTRSLVPPNNRENPAEIINYEPKYLWIFREILGGEKVLYKEVAP